MSYQEALEAAGAEVLVFEQFGSYQGDWLARVLYEGQELYINGSYGSCSGCDAFEAEFGFDEQKCNVHIYQYDSPDCTECKAAYQQKLADFGRRYPQLPGRKILIRGNHDRNRSISWWMSSGFDFACDSVKFRNCWLTHEPDPVLPEGCTLNLHGHLHNIWHGFLPAGQQQAAKEAHRPFQRLFAVEYTNYCPIEFDEFVAHPDKYLARGFKQN